VRTLFGGLFSLSHQFKILVMFTFKEKELQEKGAKNGTFGV